MEDQTSITDLDIPGREEALDPPREPQKRTVLSRNDQKWESLKQEIWTVYMMEKNTLPQTMLKIEQAHNFKASPRKWKAKLKEWGFEKHLSENDMKIVVAKVDNRKRAGKDTAVFHNGLQIPAEKIDNFKRRKIIRESGPASPSAPTPGPVTYCTPRFDMDMDFTIELDETAELDDNFEDLDIFTSDLSTQVEPLHSSADHINGASAEDTMVDSRLLSTDGNGSLGLNSFASNSIDDCRSEVAEGYIWSHDRRRIITSASKLLPAINIFNSDGLESSQSSITGNRNAAANEYGHGEEHDRLSSNAPLSVPGGLQKKGDVQNQGFFVASVIRDDNSPIIGDKYLAVNEAPDMAPARFTHEEANLSALGEAIDKCFEDGFGLDLTISQLLSLFTYLQGSSPEPEELSEGSLSYWKMKEIATLARNYIEKQQHSAAVLLYKRVIINAWGVGGVLSPAFTHILEGILRFASVVKRQCYLKHELAVLQLVVAGYFKLQLSAENPSLLASVGISGVVQRLRGIHNATSSFLGEDLNQKFRSLTQTVNGHLDNHFYQDRHFCDLLLFNALDLANCYSLRGEFKIAGELFQLRSIPSGGCVMPTFKTNHRRTRAEEWFEQHQRWQQSVLSKPWDVITEAPLNTKPGDVLLALEYQEGLYVQIERLFRSLFEDCKQGWMLKAPDRPAENKEVGFINL